MNVVAARVRLGFVSELSMATTRFPATDMPSGEISLPTTPPDLPRSRSFCAARNTDDSNAIATLRRVMVFNRRSGGIVFMGGNSIHCTAGNDEIDNCRYRRLVRA